MTRGSSSGIRWVACAEAGCVYALCVFAIGFFLGTIRVFLIVPRLGDTAAVLLEVPFMLAASWKMSRWSAKMTGLLANASEATLMGGFAFAVLMLAEWVTSALYLNRTVGEYFAGLWSVPGAIGLAAQLCFAGFPFLQARNS